MHTLRLLLNTTSYEEHQIERRFHALSHVHNVLVKHAKKLLFQLKSDKSYQLMLQEYIALKKKDTNSKEEKRRVKELSKTMSDIRIGIGLSEYGLQSYITVCAKQYKKLLSSQQVQKEATRVWRGVEKVLFGNGKHIHFKKYMNFDTIGGKSNTNGAKFNKEALTVDWIGLSLTCKPISQDDLYKTEALSHNISYCEIERKMFNNGWHYYVILYLQGNSPKKLLVTVSDDVMGIDPGVSTMAGASSQKLVLKELAPEAPKYNTEIRKLQKHMDTSKRATNPKKYLPDGTINKTNHDRWVFSKTYLKNRQKLKCIFRKKSAYTKQSHEIFTNELLIYSKNFIVEDMDYAALAKKSKKPAKRSEKTSTVKQKNGSAKSVHKFKKKKRFGKSMNNRSPSLFLKILERKAILYGGSFQKANTKTLKASQYNHATDEYDKVSLNTREKEINGHVVQRDLYSAFLIKNVDNTFEHVDREKCLYEFDNFIKLHDNLIHEMKDSNVTMKQCFGF